MLQHVIVPPILTASKNWIQKQATLQFCGGDSNVIFRKSAAASKLVRPLPLLNFIQRDSIGLIIGPVFFSNVVDAFASAAARPVPGPAASVCSAQQL